MSQRRVQPPWIKLLRMMKNNMYSTIGWIDASISIIIFSVGEDFAEAGECQDGRVVQRD